MGLSPSVQLSRESGAPQPRVFVKTQNPKLHHQPSSLHYPIVHRHDMVKLTGAINEQLGVRAVWSLQVEVQPDLPWLVHIGSVGDRRGLQVDLTRV